MFRAVRDSLRILLVLIFFSSLPAYGQVRLFTDRPAFEAATSGRTSINFASALSPGQILLPLTGPLTMSGVTFSNFIFVVDPRYGPENGAPYQGWNTNPTVLQGVHTVSVRLPPGTTAVGTDLYTIETVTAPPYTFGGPVQVTLSSGETFTINTPGKPNVSFVGFTSSSPITSLTFRPNNTSYLNLSNFTFGTHTASKPLVTITEQPKMHDDHTLRVDVTGVFSNDPTTSKSLSIKFELNGTQLDGTNCSDCKYNLPTGATGEFFNSFRVDLSSAGVGKFDDNQKFTVTATATEEGEESDPDIRDVEIPLPVVHVHGILSDTLGNYIPRNLFDLLKHEHPAYNEDDAARLTETYPTLVSFPYNSLLQSNLLTGLDLAAWIRTQVLPATYASKVNIVSHSMGGIVTRSAIWYGSASGLINKAILVGSPSEGATLAPVAVRDWIGIIAVLTILNTAARQLTSPLVQYTPGELADLFAILDRMAVAHNVTAKEMLPTYGWWANTKDQAMHGPLQIPLAYGDPFLANLNSLGLHPEVKWYAITASGKPTLTKMWGEFWLLSTIGNLSTDRNAFGPGDGIVPIQSQQGDDLGWSTAGPRSFKLIYDAGAVFHTCYFSRLDVNMKVEDIFWNQP